MKGKRGGFLKMRKAVQFHFNLKGGFDLYYVVLLYVLGTVFCLSFSFPFVVNILFMTMGY